MKKLVAVVLIFVCVIEIPLVGCAGFARSSKPAQRWYAYEYELRNGNTKDSLACEYENFAASFSVDEAMLSVKIKNIGKESIYPHYDRAMIGIGDHYYPVAFSEDALYPPASLIVPPRGYIETHIAPLRGTKDQRLPALYRRTDDGDTLVRKEILGQADVPLTLLLPISEKGGEKEYTFSLRIKKTRSSFTQKSADPRLKKTGKSSGGSIIPLVLVGVGISGALFLLSKNKTTTTE